MLGLVMKKHLVLKFLLCSVKKIFFSRDRMPLLYLIYQESSGSPLLGLVDILGLDCIYGIVCGRK